MASKNVYFFELQLFHHSEEIDYREFKNILQHIINEQATVFENYKSLDVTPYEEDMHFMMDIYDYENNTFFARMAKQKPSNSLVQHDYRTYRKQDVLPGNNENERGIEQYTYGFMNYDLGVFMLASTLGAPSEKIINNLFYRYAPEYNVELIPVPNAKAIESIYEREDSEITKLEIEVPLPDAGTLENVFHWGENEILNVLNDRNLCASIVIKPIGRGRSITRCEEETRKFMNVIRAHLSGYNKAKMKAKARNIKLREYNFFEDKFSYPIDIQNSYTQNGEKIYYSVETLAEVYRKNMRMAYNANEGILRTILSR